MFRMGDKGVSSMPPSSLSFISSSVFQNYPLISALIAFTLAQSIKFFTTWYKEKRWDPKQLIVSGGMPSSHSATVTSLTIAIGFQDGFSSSLFAASMIFASVVMYDAFGVRLHAGKQAEVLNQIVFDLPADHHLAETKPLREVLGHTPAQLTPKTTSRLTQRLTDGKRLKAQLHNLNLVTSLQDLSSISPSLVQTLPSPLIRSTNTCTARSAASATSMVPPPMVSPSRKVILNSVPSLTPIGPEIQQIVNPLPGIDSS